MDTIVKDPNHSFYQVNVIPETMYKYLTTKGLGADFLLSDLVLDERLSLDDIATLIFLNSPVQGEGFDFPFSTHSVLDALIDLKLPNKENLNAKLQTALSWSFSDRVKNNALSMLNGVYNEASPSYEFIVTGPKIWLIVKSGFLTMLQNPLQRLNIYRDYLNTVRQHAPFNYVAKSGIYARYVREIVG